MKKRFWAVMIILCLFMLTGSGCGQKSEPQQDGEDVGEKEVPLLTLVDKNSGSHAFDDRIAREIMERTGVRIEVIDSSDIDREQQNLMFACQDYPDIIKVDISAIAKYQEAGYLVDLEPYLSRMPSVEEMYGDMLDKMRTQNGQLYYLGNWYGTDLDAVSGFQIRYDYLVELVGKERADSDEPFTQEEFLDLLRAFSEKYPEIGGEPSIPFTVSLDLDYSSALQGMYGMKTYYETDGRLYHLAKDPGYVQMVSFMNQMYREGLMDKEWVVNRRELYRKKLESGRVFATACAYWDVWEENAALRRQNGEDSFFACYKVLGVGTEASQTTYGGRNSMGWDAIAVTDHCQNLDAAFKVIDFLASEEGQYLMLWGIEGEDWEYVDGRHTPTAKGIALLDEDISEVRKQESESGSGSSKTAMAAMVLPMIF